MRTEVKIGIVVGLVVIAGGVIFFLNQNRKTGNNVVDVLPMDAPGKAVGAKPAAEPNRPLPPQRQTATPPRAAQPSGTPTRAPAGPTGPNTALTRGPLGPNLPAAQQPAKPPLITTPPGAASPAGPNAARAGVPQTQPASPAKHDATAEPRVGTDLPPLVPATEPPRATPTVGGGTEPPSRPVTPLLDNNSPGSPARTLGAADAPRRDADAKPEVIVSEVPPSAKPAAAAPTKYTVKEGDSLWTIAEETYGDGHLWTKLKAANPGIDENVKVGQVINLPSKEELTAPPGAKPAAKPTAGEETRSPSEPARPAAGASTYVVQSGDTLFKIANKLLGNGHRWPELLELNKDRLARPEELKVGMELRVPVKEAAAAKEKDAKPAKENNSKPNREGGNNRRSTSGR